MKWTATWIALPILLASCAGTGAGPEACGPWRPILVHDEDALTTETARAILAHNRAGRRLCGW
jgi:hypothetical protein